jgi:glycosyltransferase domain-containing protein
LKLSEKITIIILTHERHQYLKRSLEYWAGTEIQIIIADSSANKYQDVIPNNVKYYYYPQKSYFDKVVEVLSKVNSAYCTLCADDDFLTLTGLKNCIEFLDHNQDYVCASGKVITCEKYTGSLYRWSKAYLKGSSIDSSNPVNRFTNHFKHYNFPTHYAVTRTDVLYYIWENTKTCINSDDLRFGEILPTLLLVIMGKFCLLDSLYAVREMIPNSAGSSVPSIPSYFQDGSFDMRYKKFKKSLMEELQKVKNTSELESANLVDKGLEDYLIQNHFHSSKFLKIKSWIKFILEKLGLLLIIRKIRGSGNIAPHYPTPIEYNKHDNPQYQEYLKIEKIVKKYSI